MLTSGSRRLERAEKLSLQDNRDRTVVDERYVHHRSEAACLDGVYARRAESFAEVVEELRCLLGRGGSDEVGTPALARVREEGELGDGEGCSAGVFHAVVHLPFFVGHDPESCYLLGQPVRFWFSVSVRDADEQQEARAYGGDPVSCDRNGGFFDSLEYYAQGL